jgi:SAM domain (Sterile alpha motif)
MSDVEVWLDRLGLGKYASIFAAQEVDLDTLRRLSEDDLRELGLPLGARRKNLQAAASLPETGITTPVPPASDSRVVDGPERRQITVMFADIIGSTSLAERIDIEDCAPSSWPISRRALPPSNATGGTSPSTWATA